MNSDSTTTKIISENKTCQDQLTPFFRVQRFTEYNSKVSVPTDRAIGLNARQWIDGTQKWGLEGYKKAYEEARQNDFLPANDTLALKAADKTSADIHLSAKLNDPAFLKNVADKLIEYSSLKLKLSTGEPIPADFNASSERAKADYAISLGEIDRLNAEISSKLAGNNAGGSKDGGLRDQLNLETNNLKNLDSNFELTEKTFRDEDAGVSRRISETENALRIQNKNDEER